VRLYLVASAGALKPQQPAIAEALLGLKGEQLAEEATLESAGIASGAWLVAASAAGMAGMAGMAGSSGSSSSSQAVQLELAAESPLLSAVRVMQAQQAAMPSSFEALQAAMSSSFEALQAAMTSSFEALPAALAAKIAQLFSDGSVSPSGSKSPLMSKSRSGRLSPLSNAAAELSGEGSMTQSSKSSLPGSPASRSMLLTALAGSAPFAIPLLSRGAGAVDSRALPEATQRQLLAHRLITAPRYADCLLAFGDQYDDVVKACAGKGLSFFVVLSELPAVLAAVHELRGKGIKHRGCSCRRLIDLPESLVLTLDRAISSSEPPASAPVVWHASLSPREDMPLPAFSAAFRSWVNPLPCSLAASAGAAPEAAAQHLRGTECASDLCTLSAESEPYLARKLLAITGSQGQRRQLAQASIPPSGGSPGSCSSL